MKISALRNGLIFYREYSLKNGIQANFPDDWREDYDDGLTPEEAFRNAWE